MISPQWTAHINLCYAWEWSWNVASTAWQGRNQVFHEGWPVFWYCVIARLRGTLTHTFQVKQPNFGTSCCLRTGLVIIFWDITCQKHVRITVVPSTSTAYCPALKGRRWHHREIGRYCRTCYRSSTIVWSVALCRRRKHLDEKKKKENVALFDHRHFIVTYTR